MAEQATLARPYAKAVFEIARSASELDKWSRMLTFLAAAVEEPAVRALLAEPEIDDVVKAQRLADICAGELNDKGRRFLNVLAANKRLLLLPEIRERFEVLRAEAQATLDVQVTSAYELTEEQAERLSAALKKRFQREVSLAGEVDSSLIGGAVIRAGDTVIDGSVRGRLARLAEAVQRG